MAPRFPRRERHVREDLDAAPPLRRVVHRFTRWIEHDELRETRVGEVHRDRVQPDICQGYTDLRQVPWIVDRLVHLGSECEVRFCCASHNENRSLRGRAWRRDHRPEGALNLIRTGSPGRYPSLSALTDAVSPEMGLRGPNRRDGAKTRTADRRMMPAMLAAARSTQPVLVGRTFHQDASGL